VLNDKTYKVDNSRITLSVNGLWASILIEAKPPPPSGFSLIYIYAITAGFAVLAVAAIVVGTVKHRPKTSRATINLMEVS
jgi:hypothetical protein